jgi:DNA ligase-1
LRRFSRLFEDLDRSLGSRERVEHLVAYFADVDPADAAWALQALLGRQRRRLLSGRRLREIAQVLLPWPDWLFDSCHGQVGDSAETIALLWQGRPSTTQQLPPLHHWMETLLPQLAALEGDAQITGLQELWDSLGPSELLVVNKLLTGGFRVGVGPALVLRALARLSGLEPLELQQRLMGGFTPSAEAFRRLLAESPAGERPISTPYPFFLASPLEPGQLDDTACTDWCVEWKWDGIRGQLIRRQGQAFLWSRGEELLNDSFPELISAAEALADGTVLDGEVLVWPAGDACPRPFMELQRRLGRISPGRELLRLAPAVFMAYDLLEVAGEDLRALPLRQRRQRREQQKGHGLEGQGLEGEGASERLRLSPRLSLSDWSALEQLRRQARATAAEGLMLKALASPYLAGRRRGHWWKYKLEPWRLDAVLLYAQPGSGRRASLHSDCTFGLWEQSPQGSAQPRLVTFAKAYSGLEDRELEELDRWIRRNTTERFGPVRAVRPLQVFELAFEGLQLSKRHRSGIAVRFPRISRWRHDKPAEEADTLAHALALLASDARC